MGAETRVEGAGAAEFGEVSLVRKNPAAARAPWLLSR